MTHVERTAIIDLICKALCLEDRGDTEGWEGYVDLAESALSAIETVSTVLPNAPDQRGA
jgi:hypothetical protein